MDTWHYWETVTLLHKNLFDKLLICLFLLPKSFCCSIPPPRSKAVSISDIGSGTIHKSLDLGGLCFRDREQEMQRSISLGAGWC